MEDIKRNYEETNIRHTKDRILWSYNDSPIGVTRMGNRTHKDSLMKKTFKTSRLNIEKIGNVVPQLHIHIIARFKTDSSWPLSVWVVKSKLYSKSLLKKILINMNKFFIQR